MEGCVMPIYEYQCDACGHVLETLQKISEPPLTTCPACGAAALKKLISASAFRLKGGGWYETDFKKDKQRNLHGEKEAATKDAAKTEDKPAAESSAKADKKPAASSEPSAG